MSSTVNRSFFLANKTWLSARSAYFIIFSDATCEAKTTWNFLPLWICHLSQVFEHTHIPLERQQLQAQQNDAKKTAPIHSVLDCTFSLASFYSIFKASFVCIAQTAPSSPEKMKLEKYAVHKWSFAPIQYLSAKPVENFLTGITKFLCLIMENENVLLSNGTILHDNILKIYFLLLYVHKFMYAQKLFSKFTDDAHSELSWQIVMFQCTGRLTSETITRFVVEY